MDRRRGHRPLPPPGTPPPLPTLALASSATLDFFAMQQPPRSHRSPTPFPLQAKYGNRWATVAEEMPGRTGQQCAQRWRHKVNPNIRKDKWRDDEDAKVRPHIPPSVEEAARTP